MLVLTSEMEELFLSLLNPDKAGWQQLEQLVNQTQNQFTLRLRIDYPCLSEDDIKIILLLRMRLTHQEIANIMNIQLSSFRLRRWRIKQKMNIDCQSLSDFIRKLYW